MDGALLGGEVGDVDRLDAEGLGDVEGAGGVVLDHVEAEVAGGHGEAAVAEMLLELRDLGLVGVEGAVALDRGVAEALQHLQRVGEGREVPRAVELVGEVGHRGVPSGQAKLV